MSFRRYGRRWFRWPQSPPRLEPIRVTAEFLSLAFPEGEKIVALGEFEEHRESLPTPEERLYCIENHLATLARVVSELISIVGVTNSYAIIEYENAERERMIQKAKKIAGDLGNLSQGGRHTTLTRGGL